MKNKSVDLVRIFALLLLLAGIVYFYYFIFSPHLIPYYTRFIPLPKNMNILLMGTDLVFDKETHSLISEKGHTDTLILIRINTFGNKINLLSIPRDTLVEIPNYGWQKINQAFFLGGPELTKRTVEQFLNTTVDRYVVVVPSSIAKLVDLIGGIRVYVDKDMNYVDKWGGLYINLKKGWQTLSGEQVHGFLRFRLDPLGDIGRVQRQQNFMKTLLRSLATPKMIARAPWVLGIALESIKTDLSLKEIIGLLNYSRFMSSKDINMSLLPGRFAIGEYNASVWLADIDATDDIINKYFSKKLLRQAKQQRTPSTTITIVNNTKDFEPVREIMHLLSTGNYAIIYTTSESKADIEITKVIAQKGDEKGAKAIAKQIGIEEVDISGTGSIWSDFTIVVCKDWQEKYLNKINK